MAIVADKKIKIIWAILVHIISDELLATMLKVKLRDKLTKTMKTRKLKLKYHAASVVA